MIHCYRLGGYNIVLDVASSSIHKVDDVAYDVIRTYELLYDGNGLDRKDQNVLAAQVAVNHPGVTGNDIKEIIADIEDLTSQGKLFSPDIFASVAETDYNAPLKALCMNVSHVCNMSCAYCFAGSGEYGGISGHGDAVESGIGVHFDATEGNRDAKLMSLETGRRAIDFLVMNSGERKTLDVDFFGGEPLLNWDIVKDIVRYAREIECGCGKRFRFTLTTNGLLIDDDVISFTNDQMHNVVLSLDGRPGTHDAMRKLPNGNGSYSDVVDKIRKLVEARRGKGYYIRGTYTNKNKDFVDDILHIAGFGFKEISLEPVVGHRMIGAQGDRLAVLAEVNTASLSPCAPLYLTLNDLPELCDQYEELAIEMLRREKHDTSFNFYHFNLDLTGGPCVYKRIAGCGVGTEYLAVTPSGELYPCHQFVGNPKFLMGDLRRGLTNTGLQSGFSECSIYSRSECKDCWARFYCSGGCAANAYHETGSINGISKLGCELFKKRMECAIMMHVAKSVV